MNIAFSAIILLFLILPGFVFSVSFFKTDHRPINYVPLTHKAVISLFATCVLHILWLSAISFTHYQINFHLLLALIAGAQNTMYTSAIEAITLSDIMGFFSYFLSIYFFAFVVGKALRIGIKKFEIEDDKTHPEQEASERFYPIDGDCLILKYSEIKTLNVKYLKVF